MFSFHLQTSVLCLTQDCKTHGAGKAPAHCDRYGTCSFQAKSYKNPFSGAFKKYSHNQDQGEHQIITIISLNINVLVIIPQFV